MEQQLKEFGSRMLKKSEGKEGLKEHPKEMLEESKPS